MRVLGIITEYNPFHNGHLYHLEQSKFLSNADTVVCVMSGNFIQRGEPALINKWARTKMALASGVDLVIELPVVYAMATAEFFAFGAVKLLDSLGVIDTLCFGSEWGSIPELDSIAGILSNESENFKNILKGFVKEGLSFPAARQQALAEYLHFSDASLQYIESSVFNEIMSSSNNILGIEYLKALKKLNSKITPHCIKRVSNDYNSPLLAGPISSATAIRKTLQNHIYASDISIKNIILSSGIGHSMPPESINILEDEMANGRGPVFPKDYESIILSRLRSMRADELSEYPYVSEGLENRIIQSAKNYGTLDELISDIATRRYTLTRIQRILFNLLTGVKESELMQFNYYGGPQYIRVLGFNIKGKGLLSLIKKNASLPLMVKPANFNNSCNPLLKRMLEIENQATNNYVMAYKNTQERKGGQEYFQQIITPD